MNEIKDLKKFEAYLSKKKHKEKLKYQSKTTYVLFNKEYNAYKIGSSTKTTQRIDILCKKHSNTKLVLTIPKNIEILLHRKFASKIEKINNEREWFRLNKYDLDYLKQLSVNYYENH